jgi:hypothetical protein
MCSRTGPGKSGESGVCVAGLVLVRVGRVVYV